ncbi:MAG: hypothetical protein O2948_07155 [Proteobacteria bacterium]|nr:hypothetical protein [Pseudomonadota bacterium]
MSSTSACNPLESGNRSNKHKPVLSNTETKLETVLNMEKLSTRLAAVD